EKKPSQRFQSARDLAFAIEALSGGASGPIATAPAPAKGRILARLPWAIAALACLLALYMNLKTTAKPQAESPVIRSTIVPHPDAPFADLFGAWLSPDGKYIAF